MILNKFIHLLYKILYPIIKWFWRILNIRTRGVRVILVRDNKVLLVNHRYDNLWVFPGGGIKKNENEFIAGKRECLEEVGIKINSFEKRLGEYENESEGKLDTVSVLISKDFKEERTKSNFEIKKSCWFDLDKIPGFVSRATKERIKEYLLNSDEFFVKKWN